MIESIKIYRQKEIKMTRKLNKYRDKTEHVEYAKIREGKM
jgi:hypothetical protein